MIWKKITINTNVEAADIVASVLFENGIVGAEISDNQNLSKEDLDKMFVDIPKVNVDDGLSKVSFYVSIGERKENKFENVDKNIIDNSYMNSSDNIFKKEEFDTILSNIKSDLNEYREFMDMGSLNIDEEELDDKIFLNKWKENFKSVKIDNVNILPNWEKPVDGMINIFIEPGNAFGTGQHETTKLCFKSISEILSKKNNVNFLDIGTGSGILSIFAKKLGAKKVVAIDIDENCEFNLIENLKLNNIKYSKLSNSIDGEDFIYGFGNIITDDVLRKIILTIKYDVIVANILAPVIISLITKGKVSEFLTNNGHLILSGIIEEKKDDVILALKESGDFCDINCHKENDWVSIVCRKVMHE